jgi:hypothetical protein
MKFHRCARDPFAAGISAFFLEECVLIHESMGYLVDMRKIPEDSDSDLFGLGKVHEHWQFNEPLLESKCSMNSNTPTTMRERKRSTIVVYGSTAYGRNMFSVKTSRNDRERT